jgi:hypothetical protein
MCTNITIRTDIEGSAKGPSGWVRINTAYVSFDHPYHASFDHTVNLDLVNEGAQDTPRIAIELSSVSARELVRKINEALEKAEAELGKDQVP